MAEELYKRQFEDENGKSKTELADFAENKMIEKINQQARINRVKAGETLDWHGNKITEASYSRPYPKDINEFYQRVRALGVSVDEFMKAAQERGFLEAQKPGTLKQALIQTNNIQLGKYNPMTGYYEALRQLEQAKALQDSKFKTAEKRNRG